MKTGHFLLCVSSVKDELCPQMSSWTVDVLTHECGHKLKEASRGQINVIICHEQGDAHRQTEPDKKHN